MNKTELKETFITCLERERVNRGWTQQEMAEKLEMSLPGYRKMVQGLTESIALCNAYKAAQIFNMPMSAMIESEDPREQICKKLYDLPESTCHRINYYIDMQQKIQEKMGTGREYPVDVITLGGYLYDGVVFDTYNVDTRMFDIYLSEPAHIGLYISENSFLPTFAKGDILFLNENIARNGDVTVVLDLRTRRIYIRQLIIRDNFELHPIAGLGKPLIIPQEDRPNWFSFGHVVGQYHLQ